MNSATTAAGLEYSTYLVSVLTERTCFHHWPEDEQMDLLKEYKLASQLFQAVGLRRNMANKRYRLVDYTLQELRLLFWLFAALDMDNLAPPLSDVITWDWEQLKQAAEWDGLWHEVAFQSPACIGYPGVNVPNFVSWLWTPRQSLFRPTHQRTANIAHAARLNRQMASPEGYRIGEIRPYRRTAFRVDDSDTDSEAWHDPSITSSPVDDF